MENAELCPKCGGGKTIARRAEDGILENTFAAFYCTCQGVNSYVSADLEVPEKTKVLAANLAKAIEALILDAYERGVEEAAKASK